MILVATLMVACVSSCSKNDDDSIKLTKEVVIGTWNITYAEQNGKGTEVPNGYIYMVVKSDGTYRTVFIDNTYIGNYTLSGNTLIGTTLDPITEYYSFNSIDGNSAVINYSNSEGTKYIFHATKK